MNICKTVVVLCAVLAGSGCSMRQELRNIEQERRARLAVELARSGNLTGEQVFVRNCNTCHPGGKKGMGPGLQRLAERFPSDAALVAFIRAGKGIMPAQARDRIGDKEMVGLVAYLRDLAAQLGQQEH